MADFTPRLTSAGIEGNWLWESDENPYYRSGYGMPNCTCYAWGRFWEIANGEPDKRPTLSTRDAEDWYGYTADGYERSNIPALGSVLCFADGPFTGAGHVAVVEVINDDGSIITSESAWNGYFWELHTRYPENNYIDVAGYIYQGFIINPYAGDTPVPPHGDKFKWWLSEPILRRRNYAF